MKMKSVPKRSGFNKIRQWTKSGQQAESHPIGQEIPHIS
jgi:hypothetical protein